jgi:hypothetical protein
LGSDRVSDTLVVLGGLPMNRLLVTAVAVGFLATNSWGASNLNLSKSNINRYIEFPDTALISATINLPANQSEVVYIVPPKGDFVLTEFCASPDVEHGVRLDASGFGSIAQTVNGVGCYSFTPGVSIPRGSTLTCSALSGVNSDASYFCTISGMQSK